MNLSAKRIRNILTKKRGHSKFWLATSLITSLFVLISLYTFGAIPLLYVNGEPIYAPEVAKLVQRYGLRGALDKSVELKLIQLEARRRYLKIATEDKLLEFQKLKREAELQGKTVNDLIVNSDQNYKEFSQNVETTITIYRLLGENLYVTEEDVEDYFKSNQLLFEDVDENLLEQDVKNILFSDKVSDRYTDFINSAKAKSDIDYLLLIE